MRFGFRVLLVCVAWFATGILLIFFVLPWVREIGPEYQKEVHAEVYAQAKSSDRSWSAAVLLEGGPNAVNAYAEIRDKKGILKRRSFLRQYDMRIDVKLDVLCTNEECRIGNATTNTWDLEVRKVQLLDPAVE